MPEKLSTFDGYVTLEWCARARGVSSDAARKWMIRNNIPMKQVGKTFIVRLGDVREYISRVKRQRKE